MLITSVAVTVGDHRNIIVEINYSSGALPGEIEFDSTSVDPLINGLSGDELREIESLLENGFEVSAIRVPLKAYYESTGMNYTDDFLL